MDCTMSSPYTDVVELCALLQCLGFSVKSVESSDCNLSQDEGSRTVTVNCQTSGYRVVLENVCQTCSCPTNQQNSGMWEVSGVTGGKKLNKETGSSLFKTLPKGQRDRLAKELHEIIRCIKESDDEKRAKEEDKSASMTDLKTPEKLDLNIKAETPTRYRSLDTLTSSKGQHLPEPGSLRDKIIAARELTDKKMCSRQSTYTVSSTPGSSRRRNKTSSPIQAHPSILEQLMIAERSAEEARSAIADVIRHHLREEEVDSSLSSLALDVSRISVLKVAETSKSQFASSPNLSHVVREDTKSRLKRFESASTSNLSLKSLPKESKFSRLKRISPNIFKRKESPAVKENVAKNLDGSGKMSSLIKAKIAVPVRVNKSAQLSELSPSLSARKKYSHIKSTIPRLAKKE